MRKPSGSELLYLVAAVISLAAGVAVLFRVVTEDWTLAVLVSPWLVVTAMFTSMWADERRRRKALSGLVDFDMRGAMADAWDAAIRRESLEKSFDPSVMDEEDELVTGYRLMNLIEVPVPGKSPRIYLNGIHNNIWWWREYYATCHNVLYNTSSASHILSGTCSHDAFTPPCGIYMLKECDVEQNIMYRFPCASVQCVAWGYVAEHEYGYRCENVRIESIVVYMPFTEDGLVKVRSLGMFQWKLYSFDDIQQQLASNYSVPVRIVRYGEEVEA